LITNLKDRKGFIGCPACVSALWVGQELFTGSSPIKWNTLNDFETNENIQADIDKPLQLKPWFRMVPQLHFTRQEQDLLDRLVTREVALYWAEWEKMYTADNDDARRKAVTSIVNSVSNRYLKVLNRETGNPRPDMISQAYDGKSFAVKRNYPFCTNLYIFSGAQKGSIKDNEGLENVGELGREHVDLRGCCVETLVFVLCLGERGLNIVRVVLDDLPSGEAARD